MDLSSIRADIAYVTECLRTLATEIDAQEDGPTAEQSKSWDEGSAFVKDRSERVEGYLARQAELDTLAATLDKLPAEATSIPSDVDRAEAQFHVNTKSFTRDIYDASSVRSYGEDRAAEFVGRALEVIEKDEAFARDDHRESATRVVQQIGRGGRTAEQIVVAASPAYRSAFAKWMRGQERNEPAEFTSEERAALAAVRDVQDSASEYGAPADEMERQAFSSRALALTNVTGKLVPSQLDTSVILTNNGALNPFKEISRVIPVTSNVWTGLSTTGVALTWTGSEASEFTDATPAFSNPAVTCYMWDIYVPISFQAYEDWTGGQSELEKLFDDGINRGHEAAFATGSGSSRPTGVVTAMTAATNNSIAATNGAFTVTDLYQFKRALPSRYKANATWVMNEFYEDKIRQFGTNVGSSFLVDMNEGPVAKLFGDPLYRSSTMSASIATSTTNHAMVYGDFSAYVIADRVGRYLEFAPLLLGTNRLPNGQRAWVMHGRTGGSVIDANAFVLGTVPKATA